MIVTLKGADFSQSNIGNRQKWNINYSLGYGISIPTITSVKKGDSINLILTIIDGYELTSEGVNVFMNNILLEDSVTIVNNQISIEIPSVTGHLQITIPTMATVTNLLDLDTMSNALRYSPGGYNITGSNGTKYGLFTIMLEPNSTYYLKISSGYTGGLFNTEPIKGAKTTKSYNLKGPGAGTHEIITTSDYYWLALNIATTNTSDENTILIPTDAWNGALLYKNE